MKTGKIVIRLLISFLCISAWHPGVSGQSVEGSWHGKAVVQQGLELRISVHVVKTGDAYTSTWDSPDQGAMGIPSTTTAFSFPDFSFTHAQAGFSYEGKVDAAFTEIRGNLSQGGRKIEIVFGREPIIPSAGSLADLQTRYNKKEVYITMRDGVRLFTSVYTPKERSGSNPILLNRTPYNSEPGGPVNFNVFMQVYSRYALDNYILVFQDVRGRFMSEGTFEDIRPVNPGKTGSDTDESTDTWDTVDWLVKNVEGNNGNVGIYGISYPGFYSTMGLIGSHPAVKAVSPQAPVTAWFIGDDFHHNGAFFLLDCFGFYYSNGRVFKSPTRQGFPRFSFPTPDNYDFFLSLGAIRNIAPKYLGDSIKFWNDVFKHPDYDEFWKARDPRQHLTNIKPAVLTVGGWFDAEDLYGALNLYKAIEKQNPATLNNTLVMGPWSHSQWAFGKAENLGNIYWGMDANAKFIESEKRFFDHYLRGMETGKLPEAMIFVTGKNEWQEFRTWPPENTSQKSLYFQPAGEVSWTAPLLKSAYTDYVSDPFNPVPYTEDVHTDRTAAYMTDDQRFASRRPDVADFSTDVLEEDITLTGPVVADLFVSITGTDADFVVKLIDVFPDSTAQLNDEIKVPLGGYQMLVRGEVFRGRYRNSFEKPVAFTPGRVTEVKFEMPDVAHTFKKGHRIMVQVQSSWFPLVDRNPQKFVNIYQCSDSDFQESDIRLYHDVKFPSHLKVSVLK